ncbi:MULTISPECIES: class A sortase [unclassified Streptococcus]|uniref:class A sortase n=1 Tax=unclassified Streptococcus TaxID=2608887 RepID=UPI00359D9CDE
MTKTRKTKHSKRLGRFLYNLFLFLLVIVGLALIFNKSIRNFIIGQNSNKYQVTQVTKEEIEANKEAEASFDFAAVQSLSTEAVLAAQMNAQNLPVIGGIAIPELEINLPIFKGVGNTEIAYGAGTMKPDQVMGERNYALASHHIFGIEGASKMLFSPLDNAQNGMKIYLTDKEKIYTYVISEVKVVSPEHVEVIDDRPGQTEVTLVTCTDFDATNRIIVHGTFQESVEFAKAPTEVLKAFEMKYNQRIF